MGSELARLWLAAAGLVAGALVGDAHGPGPSVAIGVFSLAALGSRRRRLTAVGLAGLCFAGGWFAAAQRAAREAPLEELASHVPRCGLVGRVLEGAGGLGTTAAIEAARCRGYPPIDGAGIVVFDGTAAAGSLIRGQGFLVPLGDDTFDRARRRLGADASFEAIHLAFSPPPSGAFRLAASIRAGLEAASPGLGPRRAGLLRGLALGDTTGLDGATIERFRRAGLSHLLAVSGSNVAIVLGAVGLLATRLPLRLRVVAAGAALALFVLVVGPEPSVLRAAAMGAVALFALAVGRAVEPLHGLALAVIAVVGARPGMVFSVGLQLSVAATAGLILFAGPIARRIRLPRPLALGLGATLAAQLAVAPVVVA
ncbi:MAG TPA: ComEC/Rec2 family competence protein, partial [Actinomycetota bacterium]|nr:ComEC/Rec2 family competence protein [Actinomycetota bacterium]